MIIKRVFEAGLVIFCVSLIITACIYYFSVQKVKSLPLEVTVDNALVIVTTAPFRPLVIYPDGRMTGFDPAAGKDVIQIPESKYYFQSEGQVPGPGSYWLGISDPTREFTLKILGENGEYYGFGVYSFRKNRQQTRTFSGRIVAGNQAVYMVVSLPSGDFPWQITQIK